MQNEATVQGLPNLPWHEIACSENEMLVSEMDLLISNANNEGLAFLPQYKSFPTCSPDYCKYYGSQVVQAAGNRDPKP